MKRNPAQLAERRHQLVAQAAAERTALAYNLVPWRARLARVDQGVAAVRYIGRHPALIAGAALLLAALRPRRAGKWLQRGWLAWRVGRRLRS
ncbi:MAG: YqjK family protein [Thiobacillus sp.]|uniref:YqjK family protein n=1 Tax=Thiobacillus sp. TaxID=924 RepID=UPI0028945E42|nr:YqjK family protein [Thiobacillus sp.]MDT3707926.1 YqjK family protein [Thiobacillus sp.]